MLPSPWYLCFGLKAPARNAARPATDDNGFEPSRLLLKRLEVLAAALQQVKELQRMAAEAPEELQMRDFSTGLLINILRETVDHVQHSAEIDQASPGVKDLKRALLEQILRLVASEPELARLATQELPQGVRNGIQ